ncbi:MAG TPA: DUF2723 domain-containing protein, partial [bacterium]|nr:DUF2723 domain-containing protein [bacterium]
MPAALPWYQRPWVVSLLCAAPLLACYLTTTAPDLTWAHSNEDSGDLVTAAYLWGIPHPTGYPFYLLTCRLLMVLLPVGTIAFRAHCYSILMGLLGSCLLGQACRRMAPHVFPEAVESPNDPHAILLQVAATLLAGASFTVWSQSIIAEVYAANYAFLGALLLMLSWYLVAKEPRERSRALVWYAGTLGLALTNHLTSAYMGVVGLAVLAWTRRLPPPTAWPRTVLIFVAPLSLYLFLLVRSRANPPLDWTNTETLPNLYLHMTGKQFRYLLLGQEPGQVLRRLFLEMDFLHEYGPLLSLLMLLGVGWSLV